MPTESMVKVTQTLKVETLKPESEVNITQASVIQVELDKNNHKETPIMREHMTEKNVSEPFVTTLETITKMDEELFNDDWLPEEMVDSYHTVQKRDAQWKAYGFDSSVLQIKDPWASRNLWFQQLTHSVKSVRRLNCPCVVKVPTPGTWPSILETIPEPLLPMCQSYVLSWLLYQQQSAEDIVMALSVHLFRPRLNCSWLSELPYVNLLDQHENAITAIPDAMVVRPEKAEDCFCSNNTHRGPGMFMGISECTKYMMDFGEHKPKNAGKSFQVTFKIPFQKQSKTVSVKHQMLPGNVTIGNFKDIWWVCGDKAYLFLPYGWTGCCYMATLKLPYEVFTMQRGEAPNKNQSNEILGNRRKRELAQFHNLESYHWRINLGEKWGIGIFPWYGVVFLADHIDNITYTLQGFANETIKGFELLSNTQRSHRLTLLKHDMALDYILAKQGGLCMTLNLTGEACYTLIPDSSDNITSVIDALRHIRDAFGPAEGAGWSANAWLQDKLGPMGAILVQILIAVILSLCVMFCFCTVLLTFAKAMILRWVGIVMPSDRGQMPLIQTTDMDEDEDVVIGGVVERYPFRSFLYS